MKQYTNILREWLDKEALLSCVVLSFLRLTRFAKSWTQILCLYLTPQVVGERSTTRAYLKASFFAPDPCT